jgi:hypothetical protein
MGRLHRLQKNHVDISVEERPLNIDGACARRWFPGTQIQLALKGRDSSRAVRDQSNRGFSP